MKCEKKDTRILRQKLNKISNQRRFLVFEFLEYCTKVMFRPQSEK